MRAAPSTMSSGGWNRCSAVLARREVHGVLVAHPPGVDAVHVDPGGVVVGRRGAGHHVERGLGHVGVRVLSGLEAPVELALDRRHVDDVLVALGRSRHERLEPRVEHERGDRVDQLGLEQLDRRHLREGQPPRVPPAQVHLLQILVEHAARGTGGPRLPRRRPARRPGRAPPRGSVPRARRGSPRRARWGSRRRSRRPASPRTLRAQHARRPAAGRATYVRAPSCGGRTREAGARSGRRC